MTVKGTPLLLGCLALWFAEARAGDTCPNVIVPGDPDVWSARPYMKETWYRDMSAEYWGLHEGDWDEGWGWAKYNDPDPYQYAFPKMMVSGQLLWSGIDDSLSLQGAWSVTSRESGTASKARLRALSRTSDSIDLLYRSATGSLIHEALSGGGGWYPGALPAGRAVLDVSSLVATAKTAYRVTGDPFALSRAADSLDVLARSGNALYAFSWSAASGWTASQPTALVVRPAPLQGRDRYFIATDPVAVSRSADALDVFAIDDLRHLIHYAWSAGSGWKAEDLTELTQVAVDAHSDPVVVLRDGGALSVFVRCSPRNRVWDKHLVHFSWAAGSSWAVEDLTAQLGASAEIEGLPAAIARGNGRTDVFARKGYHLLHFARSTSSGWAVEDLTAATRVSGACPGGSCSYVVDGDPVALALAQDSTSVFARDLNGHLIQYVGEAAGWRAANLSVQFRCPAIAEDPVVDGDAARTDVFGTGWGGSLLHCYFTPELGWIGEDPTAATSGPLAPRTIEPRPALVRRRAETLDLFALRAGLYNHYAHYTAAVGPTVNPWHGNGEYSAWAAGSLHHFPYKPTNDDGLWADAQRWIFCLKERVNFGCKGFNEAGPAERAAFMLHEATHMNYDGFSHEEKAGEDADAWIFHGVKDQAGCVCGGIGAEGACGAGWVIVFTHSPYQILVEYLCDIGEFPARDLPFSVYGGMVDRANWSMENQILTSPGWVCGEPRPLP